MLLLVALDSTHLSSTRRRGGPELDSKRDRRRRGSVVVTRGTEADREIASREKQTETLLVERSIQEQDRGHKLLGLGLCEDMLPVAIYYISLHALRTHSSDNL